jgi:hypothetical protein
MILKESQRHLNRQNDTKCSDILKHEIHENEMKLIIIAGNDHIGMKMHYNDIKFTIMTLKM